MPPRKRKSNTGSEPETPARRRRQDSSPPPSDSDDGPNAPTSTDAMIKKMVRLALSSEYSRLPIRRTDISTKVLGEQGSREFKTVFEQAQRELRTKFGMEMSELPAREKATVAQRRAAQKVEKPSTASKSWIVISTLPQAYRSPDILIPPKAPSLYTESAYTGLYSFIIALISLNGGSLAEQKLDRYLGRVNAEVATPIDRTDKLLARLCKEGYLVKTREMDGGEEIIEYILGPRGKVEVGSGAVAGMARVVYGREAMPSAEMSQFEREEIEDFEGRLARSLGIQPREAGNVDVEQGNGEEVNGNGHVEEPEEQSVAPRRGRRRTAAEEEEEEESSEDDDEEQYENSD